MILTTTNCACEVPPTHDNIMCNNEDREVIYSTREKYVLNYVFKISRTIKFINLYFISFSHKFLYLRLYSLIY